MRRSVAMILLVLLALPLLMAESRAKSWRVELDGSGDFTDIQPAVEAAADGDTILIGPGRFDTLHECVAEAWTEEVVVSVVRDNLTFLGSGVDQTIIGMEEYYWSNTEYPKGFCSVAGYSARIEHLTIENIQEGLYWWRGELIVENCILRGDHISFNAALVFADYCELNDCRFEIGSNGDALVCAYSDTVNVERCEFVGYGQGFTTGPQARVVNFRDCDFVDNRIAMFYALGASGCIENVVVRDSYTGAVLVTSNSEPMDIVNLNASGGEKGVKVEAGAGVSCAGVSVTGTTVASIEVSSGAGFSMSNSDILPLSGLAVNAYGYTGEQYVLDFTNNYWGTTEADSIATLIFDSNDDPTVHCTVQYEPFSPVPLPTEEQSLGGFKSLFR